MSGGEVLLRPQPIPFRAGPEGDKLCTLGFTSVQLLYMCRSMSQCTRNSSFTIAADMRFTAYLATTHSFQKVQKGIMPRSYSSFRQSKAECTLACTVTFLKFLVCSELADLGFICGGGCTGAMLVVCQHQYGSEPSTDSPSGSSQPENVADVLSSLSRPSTGPMGHQSMQASKFHTLRHVYFRVIRS